MGFYSGFKGLKLTDLRASVTLVDFQLDIQNSYLFICNRFIKILYMFRPYPAHLQEVYVVIVYIYSLWYRHCLQVTEPYFKIATLLDFVYFT